MDISEDSGDNGDKLKSDDCIWELRFSAVSIEILSVGTKKLFSGRVDSEKDEHSPDVFKADSEIMHEDDDNKSFCV